MSGVIWTKFFWSDWESDPALRLCSLAAQGLWMRMLCIAAAHDPIGYVAVAGRGLNETALARMTGCSESEVTALLGELDQNGVFSRDRQGRIYSRRMVNDAKKAAIARKNGKNGGNPSLGNKRENYSSDNPQDKAPVKPQEPRANSQEPKKDSSLPLGDPVEADFDEWYVLYPHKVGRGAALKAYRSARKKTGKGELLDSVKRFAAAKARDGTEKRFIPHPATWLNGERWADEAQPSSQASSPATGNGQGRPGEYQARDPADFDIEDWSIRIRLYRQNGKWAEMWGPRPPAEGNIADIARTYLQRHRRAA